MKWKSWFVWLIAMTACAIAYAVWNGRNFDSVVSDYWVCALGGAAIMYYIEAVNPYDERTWHWLMWLMLSFIFIVAKSYLQGADMFGAVFSWDAAVMAASAAMIYYVAPWILYRFPDDI